MPTHLSSFLSADPSAGQISINDRVTHVQQTIEELERRLSSDRLTPTSWQLGNRSGYRQKLLLDGQSANGGERQLYLHKPMSAVDAARTQFVTTLANLLGISTPITIAGECRMDRALAFGSVGTQQIFLEGYGTAEDLDMTALQPEAILYLLLTRWFNDLVGNLHCWWGQLLVRRDSVGRVSELFMLDFDDSFGCVDPEFLRTVLMTHFGKPDVQLGDCRWLTRPFDFRAPIGWAPDTLDSHFTIYGPLFQAFLSGRLEIDTEELCRRVLLTADLPRKVFEQTMEPFFAASLRHLQNPWVFLPAAPNPRVHIEVFRAEFLARLKRSRDEFCAFIESMRSARASKNHPWKAHYERAPGRPY